MNDSLLYPDWAKEAKRFMLKLQLISLSPFLIKKSDSEEVKFNCVCLKCLSWRKRWVRPGGMVCFDKPQTSNLRYRSMSSAPQVSMQGLNPLFFLKSSFFTKKTPEDVASLYIGSSLQSPAQKRLLMFGFLIVLHKKELIEQGIIESSQSSLSIQSCATTLNTIL